MLVPSCPEAEGTKSFLILMLVIKCKTEMWFVVYLFLCLLFLPFSLLQSSTARDKDEQTLPVGNSGSVCTLSVCLWRVWGRGGRRRAHVLNKPPSPLGYLNGLIYRYICILYPLISVNCILIITDIQLFLGLDFKKFEFPLSFDINFYVSWKNEIFPNCIPWDVELIFGDSVGSHAW